MAKIKAKNFVKDTEISNKRHSGRPLTVVDKNRERVNRIVLANRRVTIHELLMNLFDNGDYIVY